MSDFIRKLEEALDLNQNNGGDPPSPFVLDGFEYRKEPVKLSDGRVVEYWYRHPMSSRAGKTFTGGRWVQSGKQYIGSQLMDPTTGKPRKHPGA